MKIYFACYHLTVDLANRLRFIVVGHELARVVEQTYSELGFTDQAFQPDHFTIEQHATLYLMVAAKMGIYASNIFSLRPHLRYPDGTGHLCRRRIFPQFQETALTWWQLYLYRARTAVDGGSCITLRASQAHQFDLRHGQN